MPSSRLSNFQSAIHRRLWSIVPEPTVSRKLYNHTLGIRFKEEEGDYLHTETLEGAKTFALWPLSQAAQSCFGRESWPAEVPAPQASFR